MIAAKTLNGPIYCCCNMNNIVNLIANYTDQLIANEYCRTGQFRIVDLLNITY